MENKIVIVLFYKGYIRVIWGYWKKWKLLSRGLGLLGRILESVHNWWLHKQGVLVRSRLRIRGLHGAGYRADPIRRNTETVTPNTRQVPRGH